MLFIYQPFSKQKKATSHKGGGELDYQTRFISGMNIVADTLSFVKHSNKLTLTSGAKVKRRKFAPPPPPSPVIFLGKYVSLELTLAEYEITPNAATVAKIGGAK